MQPWPSLVAAAAVIALLGWAALVGTIHHGEDECQGNSDAIAALQSDVNVTVHRSRGIGYGFVGPVGVVPPFLGGPNVTRGVVIMPEEGVAPEAYAPLARGKLMVVIVGLGIRTRFRD